MRIQEVLIVMCHYFNALWLQDHTYSVSFI